MARTAAPTTTTPAATVTATAEATTTVGGHAVQIMAFIPENTKDLRSQGRILDLLADVKEGKKTIADLADFLKGIEVKANYIRKRFTKSELDALNGVKPSPAPQATTGDEGGEHVPETADEAIQFVRDESPNEEDPEGRARAAWPHLFPKD